MGPATDADDELSATTFVVIDFEGTTPKGHRPEPIEVAAVAVRVRGDDLAESGRFAALIRPPPHAAVTAFDTAQTGISAAVLAGQPPASEVLAHLDARLITPPYLLVAHHAPTEAAILHAYREHCPTLATTDLLDTLRLARAVYPDLPAHGLDALTTHLGLARPAGRHRALPDVQLTVALLGRLLVDARARGWRTLRQLKQLALCRAKAGQPEQQALFD